MRKVNIPLPAQRICYLAPHQVQTVLAPHLTHNSAGSRTRPAHARTRNPRGLTRPAQGSSWHNASKPARSVK